MPTFELCEVPWLILPLSRTRDPPLPIPDFQGNGGNVRGKSGSLFSLFQ
jgi:hypothetical protein